MLAKRVIPCLDVHNGQVTRGRPLMKKEILKAIAKLGYRFATKDPLNTLNALLYAKKQFKNQNGKFSPA